MKHINCPNCGCKLFDGDDGSHIIIKCCKCGKLFEATVNEDSVVVVLKSKVKESKFMGKCVTAQT